MTIHVELLPEQKVRGRRLGRHVHFDERSRDYRVAPANVGSVLHRRRVPDFNQGDLGSCTGNAMAGALSTLPFMHRFGEPTAVRIYSQATSLDDIDGSYPPEDTGSSSLGVLKAAQAHGWISQYRWCFNIEDVLSAIQQGPLICGITWLTGCDEPDENGLVHYTGSVRGGHEIEVRGYDAINDEFRFSNSWGTGWSSSLKGDFLMSRADFATALEDQGDCALGILG